MRSIIGAVIVVMLAVSAYSQSKAPAQSKNLADLVAAEQAFSATAGNEGFRDSVLTQTKFELIDGKIASSDDLAFTYGKYSTVNDPKGVETGYYVHVWRRDADAKWRLVADIQSPLPKSDK